MPDFFRRKPTFNREDAEHSDGPVVPDGLWVKCTSCKDLVYSKDFERWYRVCPKCDHHARLTATQRLNYLLDSGSFEEWDRGIVTADPLHFSANGDAYHEKVQQASQKSGQPESLVTGRGRIQGYDAVVAATEFAFLGASMGSAFGEKFVRAVEKAVELRLPFISISNSGGARMHESTFSLMQMAKTTAALSRLGEHKLPHVSILTDPCYGGVTASYATVADIIIAEPGAMIGFAGPRVIEQITRQKLPAGFQTAEFLLKHGMIDMVCRRSDLPETIALLLLHYADATMGRHTPGYAHASTGKEGDA
ncbi:MAG: acetyl-CoA carboxylase carboxyltransferase subunit beta [Sphaerobacteraceae bacterium]|nr:MAG: acetyl-CoA carboxylase carboxyltransferase subunit beta [Sphaerobacteraceae bacterium]